MHPTELTWRGYQSALIVSACKTPKPAPRAT
jgi:hypothetical protein